jgi:hypothetical protein
MGEVEVEVQVVLGKVEEGRQHDGVLEDDFSPPWVCRVVR